MCFCTHAFKYKVNSAKTPAANVFGTPPATAPVSNCEILAGLGDGLVEDAGDGLVEDAGDGLVEDAGDGLVDDAGDGLVEAEHPQYKEDELPLSTSLLFAFTPPEGQLVAALA
jgi:hypothetical protein